MNQITEQLWIGDIGDAREGDTSRFDRIVSVCQDHAKENTADSISYFHFNMADSPDTAGMYGGKCNYQIFEAAVDNVLYALRNEEAVLVHCHVGQNRSAAVCMAALGAHEGIPFGEAYERVEDARPMVNPMATMRQYAERYVGIAP